MKTILIKLNYGEEIIGEAIEQNDGFYIKNVATLLPTEEMSWHLITWMPYTNVRHGVHIKNSDILFVTELSSEMDEYYAKWKQALEKNIYIKDQE